jgi:hypothetical protein
MNQACVGPGFSGKMILSPSSKRRRTEISITPSMYFEAYETMANENETNRVDIDVNKGKGLKPITVRAIKKTIPPTAPSIILSKT